MSPPLPLRPLLRLQLLPLAVLTGCFWIGPSDHGVLLAGLDDDCHQTDWYRDADGDGFGDVDDTTAACQAPEGFVALATDCDDGEFGVNPDSEELCNGADDNCDGETDESTASDAGTWYEDLDLDGFGVESQFVVACEDPGSASLVAGDCDDADAAVHPDAAEVCNSIDDDCDRLIDDDDDSLDTSTALTWYLDADDDSYGDAGSPVLACAQPDGATGGDTDCDDASGLVNPAATEVCNGTDDDCDELSDDEDDSLDASTRTAWYPDVDTDSFGSASAASVLACAATGAYPAGSNTDCDDADAAVNPGATEVCNDGLDDDCDGTADDADATLDLSSAPQFHADADTDGYGSSTSSHAQCLADAAYPSATADDCDDSNSAIHPSASEVCNGYDDDCDAYADELDPSLDTSTQTLWYQDDDSDGVGKDDVTALLCVAPPGYVSRGGDCNDDDAYVTDVDYQVSFVDSSGTTTDYTAEFQAGTTSAIASWAFPADGTLRVCAGTWYVLVDNPGYDAVLAGYGGRENVILDGDDTYANGVIHSAGGSLAVSGLTVTNGYANYGGGVYAEGTEMSIDDCVVTGNRGYDGAGIATAGAGTFEISNSLISDNSANGSGGGGLFFWDQGTAPTITDCTITGNSATSSSGGGVFTYASDTVIQGGEISGNTSNGYGGGVFFGCNAARGVINGTTIADNVAASYGGGVGVDCNITVTISDATITGNEALSGGGLALFVGNNTIDIRDSIVSENSATYGGGAWVFGGGYGSSLSCTGSSAQSGFWNNVADFGGGVMVDTGGYLYSTTCDWDGTATNAPEDVYTEDTSSFNFGDDATFSCGAATGCL